MDLLLQAARVLELEQHDDDEDDEEDDSGEGAGNLKSARGAYFHHRANSRSESGEVLDESQFYNDNIVGTGDDLPLTERTSRRVGGVGTREVHNQLEKNRRKQLREFFTHLQQCVPSLENKRVPTQSILQAAIKHIKNLKKKDVDQEREIQTLARRKSDLKKRYDLEFNKCTEEQQIVAGILLKSTKSDTVSAEQDGHTSDSTSTASEGPSNEDDFSEGEAVVVPPSLKTVTPAGDCDRRKRKLPQRTSVALGAGMVEPTPNSARSGVSARSLVSSSSVALKNMLEQRKRNQAATGQASSAPWGVQTSGLPTRGPGSLTYSYPMITTHLASAVRPSISTSDQGAAQTSQLIVQSSAASFSSRSTASPSPTVSSTQSTPISFFPKKNKKGSHIRTKSDNFISYTTHNSALTSQIMSSMPLHLSTGSPLTLMQNPAFYPAALNLVQPPAMTSKSHDASRNADISFTTPTKIMTSASNLDIQSFNYLGQAVIGSQAGALQLESPSSLKRIISPNISSHKILPTVIPFSLAPILRTLPVTSGLPSHMVALGSSPLALCSSSSGHPTTSIAASSLLNSKVQLSQGGNYLLTSSSVAAQQSSIALSTHTGRITALLPASSSHIATSSISYSNSIIKPVSPIYSMSTSCSSSMAIPATIAQSLMPLSLTNGPLATKTSRSPGSPLRIFTPLSQSSVLAAPLANDQSTLMPTVIQLEPSGKVALLHNLIPGQQLQIQNPHHILTQPIVLMATGSSDFEASSSIVTTSSPHIS